MKNFIYFIVSIIVITSCSCGNKNEEVSQLSSSEIQTRSPYFERDSLIISGNHGNQISKVIGDTTKLKVYFVQKWNTPDFFIFDSSATGIDWDRRAFVGYDDGRYIHYSSPYRPISSEYKERTKSSIIFTENMFQKKGVTEDPRNTANWLYQIQVNYIRHYNDFDLNLFLLAATTIDALSDPRLQNFLAILKQKILNTRGKTPMDKLLNYTAAKVKGSPADWDTWESPGHYKKETGE